MIAVVDIGGTKLAAAAADGMTLGDTVRVPTAAGAPLQQLTDLIDRARDGAPLEGVAIAAPGPFDRDQAALLQPPGMPETWWRLPVGAMLAERYGCRVVMENDANCAALAEARHGAGAGAATVVYFTVSTGIGSGVVHNLRLLRGRNDTEGGHMVLWPEWAGGPDCHCGGHGCLESLASGRAIERRFGTRAELLQDQAAWDDVGRWLGLAVVNATSLFDPDCVLFGGGVTAAWDRFAASLLRTVAGHLFLQPPPRVERGSLGERRNLVGALSLLQPGPGAAATLSG